MVKERGDNIALLWENIHYQVNGDSKCHHHSNEVAKNGGSRGTLYFSNI